MVFFSSFDQFSSTVSAGEMQKLHESREEYMVCSTMHKYNNCGWIMAGFNLYLNSAGGESKSRRAQSG